MRRTAPSTVAILLGLVALLVATEAEAQRRGALGPGRPVRIEGFWGGTRTHPEVIGTLVVSPDGKEKRTFGVTAAAGYQPPEEGVQIFRHSTAQPIALILRGRSELVASFMDAKPEERIVAFGMYMAGSAQLVLSTVEVKTLPPPDPPD